MEKPTRSSSAYVILLCCVAAIGGFLFGFDSGVINGTVDALAQSLWHSVRRYRLCRSFRVARLCRWRLRGRQPRRLVRPTADHALKCNSVLDKRGGDRRCELARIFHRSTRCRGSSDRCRERIGANVYRRGRFPRRYAAASRHCKQMAIVTGLFFAFLSNDILARLAGGAGASFWFGAPAWRWMFWMEALPAAAFMLGILRIPESPRFLIFRGMRERAREIFARIGGDAEGLVRQVEESLKGEHRPRLSDLVIPGTRRIAPVLWVGMGLAAFQQFVGINIIFYYGEILWKQPE